MADWAGIFVSALGIFKSVNRPLLEVLGSDNELLESIQDDFSRMLLQLGKAEGRLDVTCFFEELPLPVVGKVVVSKDSAIIPGYNRVSIHADHRDMVRFGSTKDRGFIDVLGLLKRWQSEVR